MPPSLAPGLTPLMAFVAPVILLVFSNIFMTFAWYGHLWLPDPQALRG